VKALLNVIAVIVALGVMGCKANTDVPTPVQQPMATVPPFDSQEAFGFLTAQCALGPRAPGTDGHPAGREYIVGKLQGLADKVEQQNFNFTDSDRHVELHLTNILAKFNPSAPHPVMICAHWDTRPTADEDFTVSNRTKPIPGADDGASGVAVLLELAKVFKAHPPHCGVVLAFWDGEDWGPKDDKMYLGASYYAHHLPQNTPSKAVLIDMIGQKGLQIPEEQYSAQNWPDLTKEVWGDAAKVGEGNVFVPRCDYAITDDQIPIGNAGIPSIDLIDFNYAYWHTLMDTPDKCDAASLGDVGVTLEQFVYSQPQ